MSLRKKNGRWEYRFQLAGQKVRESTGLAATARNRRRAEQMEAAHRMAIVEGRLGIKRLIPRTFADACKDFLDHCKASRKDSTQRRIAISMTSAKAFFRDTIVGTITAGQIENYQDWRLTGDPAHQIEACKPVTVKHDLDNLSLLFQWCMKQEYARENPVNSVDRPSDKAARREHILSLAEERLYFSRAKGNLRDLGRLIILQGLRPDEAMKLRKEDVDLDRGYLHVRQGKTDAARRRLRLTDEARSILAARMETVGPWVFPSSRRGSERHITKLNCPHDRLCRKTGLSFVLYDLRHTFATRCIEAGVDVVSLSKLMGHTTVRVTERYIHLSQAAKDRAMEVYNQVLEQCRAKELVH